MILLIQVDVVEVVSAGGDSVGEEYPADGHDGGRLE